MGAALAPRECLLASTLQTDEPKKVEDARGEVTITQTRRNEMDPASADVAAGAEAERNIR